VYRAKGIPDSVISRAQLALGHFQRYSRIDYIEISNYNLALGYKAKKKWAEALAQCEKSIELARQMSDSLILHDAYILMADIYKEQGQYEKAYESFWKAASITESQNDLGALGVLYHEMGETANLRMACRIFAGYEPDKSVS
jgi:tetratricopeptide (TPR) repeat protein